MNGKQNHFFLILMYLKRKCYDVQFLRYYEKKNSLLWDEQMIQNKHKFNR